MKRILILSIIILSSCNPKFRSILNPKFDKDVVKDSTTVVVDTIRESSSGINLDNDSIVLQMDKSINPTNPIKVRNTQKNNQNKSDKKTTSETEVDIVDNTNDQLNTSEGIIAYSIPTKMVVGQKYNIKVRVTKDREGKDVLVVGDRNIPINDPGVDSKITIEDIRVEKVMTAELLCDTSAFSVHPLSSKVQNIDDKGYTEWAWLVTPLKSGKGYLKLIIKVRIDDDVQKDIVVFDKNIDVDPDRIYSIKSWFSSYWQWLMSTIIIPFIIWLYKRRKKDKEEKEEED